MFEATTFLLSGRLFFLRAGEDFKGVKQFGIEVLMVAKEEIVNKILFISAFLVVLQSCSPNQPSKPGPGPKPPVVVEELGPDTPDSLIDLPE